MVTPTKSLIGLIAALERMDRLDDLIDLSPEGDAAIEAFDAACEDAMEAYRALRDAPDVLADLVGLPSATYGGPE